jgi:hypothetical protein
MADLTELMTCCIVGLACSSLLIMYRVVLGVNQMGVQTLENNTLYPFQFSSGEMMTYRERATDINGLTSPQLRAPFVIIVRPLLPSPGSDVRSFFFVQQDECAGFMVIDIL